MATLDVVTRANEKAGSVDLEPGIFEAEVKEHLLHTEVRRQLALRRAGTHSSKNRARVSGGGAKPYRQKGTGRARQGTIRAPQWAGGGVVFGPIPRHHEHKVPKKVRRAALVSALSARLSEGAITIVDTIELEEYKTRAITKMLESFGLAGASVLIVIAEVNEKVERSVRNIARVNVIRVEGLNVYDLLRHERLVLTQAAVAALQKRLWAQPEAPAAENPAADEGEVTE